VLNVALFGPPGAGKGTQSESLVREFNLFYISTGDLLRKEIAGETKLGLEARSMLIKHPDERSRTDRCMPYGNTTAKIVQRLAEHETKTAPVIEKYSQLHGVVKVNGMGSFAEVFERTSTVLESLFRAG
jgi:adenylate kinase family enzyme